MWFLSSWSLQSGGVGWTIKKKINTKLQGYKIITNRAMFSKEKTRGCKGEKC